MNAVTLEPRTDADVLAEISAETAEWIADDLMRRAGDRPEYVAAARRIRARYGPSRRKSRAFASARNGSVPAPSEV